MLISYTQNKFPKVCSNFFFLQSIIRRGHGPNKQINITMIQETQGKENIDYLPLISAGIRTDRLRQLRGNHYRGKYPRQVQLMGYGGWAARTSLRGSGKVLSRSFAGQESYARIRQLSYPKSILFRVFFCDRRLFLFVPSASVYVSWLRPRASDLFIWVHPADIFVLCFSVVDTGHRSFSNVRGKWCFVHAPSSSFFHTALSTIQHRIPSVFLIECLCMCVRVCMCAWCVCVCVQTRVMLVWVMIILPQLITNLYNIIFLLSLSVSCLVRYWIALGPLSFSITTRTRPSFSLAPK